MTFAYFLLYCAVACLTGAAVWAAGPAGLAACGVLWAVLAVLVPWDRLDADDERRG